MKTYRIVTVERNINISMPDILFWFFRRYATVKTDKLEGLQGASMAHMMMDEEMTNENES